ncbi:membrane protein insertase YidC [Terriglobus aquaticus]|uniref:Membrane protein insertase YidC n=1 Tax=Terriglobus aquaticus TaxID=940139 RepID=A0ABW9KF84_9BACT|nr:membrane protein insertase YidC [Terriglobus aquaticus]
MAEIRNPNQGGGGDSNKPLLYMMLAMIVAFTVFQMWRGTKTQPLQKPTATNSATAPNAAGKSPVPTGSTQAFNQQAAGTAGAGNAAGAAAAVPAVVGTAEQTTVVENQLYRIAFSSRGGEVRSWVLKGQKDRYGAPLDLVHGAAAKQFGYPMSIYTYDQGQNANLKQALFVPSATGNLLAPQTLTFHYAQGGYDITKTFRFDETYVVHAEAEVKQNGVPVRALLAWPGGFGDQEQAQDYNSATVETMRGGKEEHLAFKKVVGGDTLNAPVDFAGVADQYFAAVMLPENIDNATAVTLSNKIDVQKLARDGKATGKSVDVPLLGVAVGATDGPAKLRVFAGPKSVPVLKSVTVSGRSGESLAPIMDFGFFGPIAKGLFWALYWTHEHLASNWGWAIVVLTVLINAVLIPLRVQTMKSALKMQRIQPQMDAIKAKYAKYKVTDPKKAEMNAEIMDLQKKEGVNMLGGCIPTLIQLPLLFAMLSTIPKVFELRGAHWFWLHDLTAADPWHVLPITLVISQFLVSFYMPSPGVDPAQQRMMAFMMPAFSLFITWNYASGLGIYWVVGNILMVITQLVMNQTALGKEMRALAAKRARKKANAPQGAKVIQGRR